MIIIFDNLGKVNFVDSNNVFVGFDYTACCCEDFGYFFSKEVPTSIDEDFYVNSELLENFVFDTDFFQELNLASLYEGGAVVFKMVDNNNNDLYLTLYNSHNGYYSHGFKCSKNEVTLYEGCL